MFISNQKKSSRSPWNASEQRRKFSTLLELKKKIWLKKEKIKQGRPGCSLCHPGFCFSHRGDDHLSTLLGEKQWFLLARASTRKAIFHMIPVEGKKGPSQRWCADGAHQEWCSCRCSWLTRTTDPPVWCRLDVLIPYQMLLCSPWPVCVWVWKPQLQFKILTYLTLDTWADHLEYRPPRHRLKGLTGWLSQILAFNTLSVVCQISTSFQGHSQQRGHNSTII